MPSIGTPRNPAPAEPDGPAKPFQVRPWVVDAEYRPRVARPKSLFTFVGPRTNRPPPKATRAYRRPRIRRQLRPAFEVRAINSRRTPFTRPFAAATATRRLRASDAATGQSAKNVSAHELPPRRDTPVRPLAAKARDPRRLRTDQARLRRDLRAWLLTRRCRHARVSKQANDILYGVWRCISRLGGLPEQLVTDWQ